jgi:cell division protein ZapA
LKSNVFIDKGLDKVSVVVQIGGKEYPMKVKATDEAKVLQAADLLNESMGFYRTNFHIVEKQDLLAMAAFDAFFEKLANEEKRANLLQSISLEIDSLSQQLTT